MGLKLCPAEVMGGLLQPLVKQVGERLCGFLKADDGLQYPLIRQPVQLLDQRADVDRIERAGDGQQAQYASRTDAFVR